jgi:hypothetical protein
MNSEEVSRLRSSLDATRDYLNSRGETLWADRMTLALDMINRNDFSFVGDLYSRVAPTCEIENLFITEPKEQWPPMMEDQANIVNNKLADIINELSSALEPFVDRA